MEKISDTIESEILEKIEHGIPRDQLLLLYPNHSTEITELLQGQNNLLTHIPHLQPTSDIVIKIKHSVTDHAAVRIDQSSKQNTIKFPRLKWASYFLIPVMAIVGAVFSLRTHNKPEDFTSDIVVELLQEAQFDNTQAVATQDEVMETDFDPGLDTIYENEVFN